MIVSVSSESLKHIIYFVFTNHQTITIDCHNLGEWKYIFPEAE